MAFLHNVVGEFLAGNITTFVSAFKSANVHSAAFVRRLFILSVFFPPALFSAFERTAQPVALTGTAYANLYGKDVGAFLLNPSAIAGVQSFYFNAFYSPSPFGLQQLANRGALVACPTGFIDAGLCVTSSGFSLYKEVTASASIARTYNGILSAGCTVNYDHLAISRYGSASVIGIDLGATVQVADEIRWGFSLLNVNRPSLAGSADELPEIYTTGISCEVIPTANISFALVKDVRFSPSVRAGAEFSPHEILQLRFGVSTEPSRYYAGIGIRLSVASFEYGVATHLALGLTHSIGISIGL
ncbi:MAG TPA: hypothetical protein VMM58_10000 [Bacteroidota bacterium]|nr:hypothetical protein [Bacteroidota bacterium]